LFLCPECSKTHTRASLIPKIFPGVIPRTHVKWEDEGKERREEGRGGEMKGCVMGDGRPCKDVNIFGSEYNGTKCNVTISTELNRC